MISPLTKLTLAYIIGIACGVWLKLPLSVELFILVTLAVLSFRNKTAILGLCLLLGLLNFQLHDQPRQKGTPDYPLFKAAKALNENLLLETQKAIPEPYATLSISMVFGAGAAKVPLEINDLYKRAGLSHLLVASGMQVGLLAGVCIFLVNLLRLPSWLGVLLSSLANWGFALLAGFGPSIMRAAIMAQVTLLGRLFGREAEIYTSLSLSALLILIFDPAALFDIGCQLSYAATWAMVYISPILLEKLRPLPKPLAVAAAGSSAPLLATLPITLFHFGQTSLVALLANIIILPWIGVVVILGFAAAVLGLICWPLGAWLNNSNFILLWLAHQIITFFGSWQWAMLYFPPPKIPLVAAYYVCLVAGLEALKRGRWPKLDRSRKLILFLALVTLVLWNTALSDPSGRLVVSIIDVGQGDAIHIRTPDGNNILIDGGDRGMGRWAVIPFLRRHGVNHLDLVILTHPHEDHLAGLLEVMEQIKVDEVLEPGLDPGTVSYRRFIDLIRKNRCQYHLARAGQTLGLGQEVKAEIFHPAAPFVPEVNPNNVSIVCRLKYRDFTMMLTGDNEQEGEEAILARFPPASLTSLILKAGHHGSRTASSLPFLEAVRPHSAVIPVGRRNKFRHPHQVTLKSLQSRGIRILRTDRLGTISISTDGERYSLAPQRWGE